MSTTLAKGDVFLVRHEFELGNDKAFNLLHYQVTSLTEIATGLPPAVAIPLLPHMPAIAGQLYAHFEAAWAPNAVAEVTMRRTMVQSIEPAPRSTQFTYSPVDPTEGFKAGEPLPLQDTATVLKRTAYGQRWGMGRIFFCGISEASQDAGRLLAQWVDDVNTGFQGFHNAIGFNSAGYAIGLQAGVYRGNPAAVPRFLPCTSFQLSDDVVKTQRRRRPGKGI